MKKNKIKKFKYTGDAKALSKRCPPAGSTMPMYNENGEVAGQKYMNRKARRNMAPSYKEFQRMQKDHMKKMMDDFEKKAKEVGAEAVSAEDVLAETTDNVTMGALGS